MLLTEERIKIPAESIAFISMKASIKYHGLVNVSGFHVDPGFVGRLQFAVFNAGPMPVHLRRGQPCFMIWYSDLSLIDGIPSKDLYKNESPHEHIDFKALVQGDVRSIDSLNERLEKVEKQQVGLIAVAGVFAGAVISLILKTVLHL